MANSVRIRDLISENDLKNAIIPVDKNSYTDNARQISISGLTSYVLFGFTGSTTIYSPTGSTINSVGGLQEGSTLQALTITELFSLMFYGQNLIT